jgi:CheY-like chemotaxis protein
MRCRSILIAEDDLDVREALEDALTTEGYAVRCVSDGRAALAELERAQAPTLVLLDLMMPTMSGWEFLDAHRASDRLSRHPVVTISAVPATESIEDPTPLRTSGALAKPLDILGVLEQVRKHCGVAE